MSTDTNRFQQAEKLVEEIKKEANDNNVSKAWELWCRLYDLYPVNPEKQDYMDDVLELHRLLNTIDNDTVYAVTDYGRRQSYLKMGLY